MIYIEPIVALFFFSLVTLILCLVILLAAKIFSFSIPNAEKNIAYECGYKPFDYASYPFDIHFYRVGILFLLFDVEIIFLFPWVLNFYQLTLEGHYVVFSFIGLLLLGFIYEIKSEALNWYPILHKI